MDLNNKLQNSIFSNGSNQDTKMVREKKLIDLSLKLLSCFSNSKSSFNVLNNVVKNRLKLYKNAFNSKYNQSFVVRIELSITDVGHKPLLNHKIQSLTKSIVFNLRQCLKLFNSSLISKESDIYIMSSVVYSTFSLNSMSSKQSVLSSPHVDKIGQTTYVKEFNKSKIVIIIPIYYFSSLCTKETVFNVIKTKITKIIESCSNSSSKMRISGEFFFK